MQRYIAKKWGFTLVELLIVVAIIAILAAIAVPNFLEAQTRAKISRVKADMRAFAVALESYCVDNNAFPMPHKLPPYGQWYGYMQYITPLSTPVAYMSTTLILDPFWPKSAAPPANHPEWRPTFRYFDYQGEPGSWMYGCHRGTKKRGAIITSFGPNRKGDGLEHYPYFLEHPDRWSEGVSGRPKNFPGRHIDMLYDSTNGTRSAGDIGRSVGDLRGTAGMGH